MKILLLRTRQIRNKSNNYQVYGELHLEVIVDRLLREFNVDANMGQPQVAYKESISNLAKGEGKFIKQTGGRGQYGHVILDVVPLGRGEGFEFENKIVGGAIPREYIPSVEKGASCLKQELLQVIL